MVSETSGLADIRFFYATSSGSTQEGGEVAFFSQPGDEMYNRLMNCFSSKKPYALVRGKETIMMNLKTCTVITCERRDFVKTQFDKQITIKFNDNVKDVTIEYNQSDAGRLFLELEEGMEQGGIVATSNKVNKTVFFDSSKVMNIVFSQRQIKPLVQSVLIPTKV